MKIQAIHLIGGLLSFFFGVLTTWVFLRFSITRLKNYIRDLQVDNKKIEGLRLDNENLKIRNMELTKDRESDLEKLKWMESAEEKLREAFDSLASRAF